MLDSRDRCISCSSRQWSCKHVQCQPGTAAADSQPTLSAEAVEVARGHLATTRARDPLPPRPPCHNTGRTHTGRVLGSRNGLNLRSERGSACCGDLCRPQLRAFNDPESSGQELELLVRKARIRPEKLPILECLLSPLRPLHNCWNFLVGSSRQPMTKRELTTNRPGLVAAHHSCHSFLRSCRLIARAAVVPPCCSRRRDCHRFCPPVLQPRVSVLRSITAARAFGGAAGARQPFLSMYGPALRYICTRSCW